MSGSGAFGASCLADAISSTVPGSNPIALWNFIAALIMYAASRARWSALWKSGLPSWSMYLRRFDSKYGFLDAPGVFDMTKSRYVPSLLTPPLFGSVPACIDLRTSSIRPSEVFSTSPVGSAVDRRVSAETSGLMTLTTNVLSSGYRPTVVPSSRLRRMNELRSSIAASAMSRGRTPTEVEIAAARTAGLTCVAEDARVPSASLTFPKPLVQHSDPISPASSFIARKSRFSAFSGSEMSTP